MLRFSHILCPIDFDQASLRSVRLDADLAQEDNAVLYLLHVVHLHPAAEPSMSFREAEAEAQTRLEQISRRRLRAGTQFELHVVSGDAAGEILHAATQFGIDLIVMATHGRTGIRRLVLGSVAERVVREAPCPVLTVTHSVGARASRRRPRT